jgi:hypothetical protein
MKLALPLIAALLLILPACSSRPAAARLPRGQRAPAQAPAMIGHIVFVQLADPADYHAILHDSDWMLGTIPPVATYAAGKHLDTGRSTIRSDYDLAIYLGFNSEQDLREYVAHPQHIGYVDKWKPKLKSLRVYDMIDWPTTRFGVHN